MESVIVQMKRDIMQDIVIRLYEIVNFDAATLGKIKYTFGMGKYTNKRDTNC